MKDINNEKYVVLTQYCGDLLTFSQNMLDISFHVQPKESKEAWLSVHNDTTFADDYAQREKPDQNNSKEGVVWSI